MAQEQFKEIAEKIIAGAEIENIDFNAMGFDVEVIHVEFPAEQPLFPL